MATMRRKEAVAPLEILAEADALLWSIQVSEDIIRDLTTEYNDAVTRLAANYESRLRAAREGITNDARALIALMKSHRRELFAATDIVRLSHGALIRELASRVTIPRDALAKCEELGFADAIKIAKSLDREAVEKWPDARLLLIGAERKQREEFSYDLAKEPVK